MSLPTTYNVIRRAIGRWRLWTALAFEDIKTTYRRSMFGVLWIGITFGVFLGVKIFIFGSILQDMSSTYYMSYLTLGFFAWQYINLVLNNSPRIFLDAENWLSNDPIELPVFSLQLVTRSLFDLSLTLIVSLTIIIIIGTPVTIYWLLLIPALLLFMLSAVWASVIIGILCTRHRDVTHLIHALLRALFFLTPIFWLPSQFSEEQQAILMLNPFFHYLEIIRAPLIDQTVSALSWYIVLAINAVGLAVAFFSLHFFRKRLIFWF